MTRNVRVSISPVIPLDELVTQLGSLPQADPVAYALKRTLEIETLGPGWRSRLEEIERRAQHVKWSNGFILHFGDGVSSWTYRDPLLEQLLRDLVALGFTVTSCGPLFDWRPAYRPKPRAFQFGAGHVRLGVMAGFMGVGHADHLVSRRWLEFGPWARLRLEDRDLTLCVFYDPDLSESPEDMTLAVEQAYPGHERMGISPVGGYLFGDHDYEGPIEGTYLTEPRRFVRVVHGRDVSQREMLDAAAFRRDSRDTDTPIERFSYVFMEEKVARRHLHELWLRELECYAIIAGQEVRLDEDYQPERSPPDWAVAVEAKWQPILEELANQ